MKTKFTTLVVLFFYVFNLNAQILWDNFENERNGTYGFISGTFIPYQANPDQTGVNTSRVAASYTRNPAEAFDVIILDAQMADLGDYLSGSRTLSIDVWSPAPGRTVQITLENSILAEPINFPTGRHSVYLATTTTAMAWETLTFSFDNQPDASVANTNVDRIVLLFDPNTNNGDQWFWDNLFGPELANDPCAGVGQNDNILTDFDCNQFLDFTFSHGGVNFRRILNPDQSGANTSDYVATYTRNGGEENDVILARTHLGLTAILPNDNIYLSVWDPGAPTNIRLSLQRDEGNGNPPTELIAVDAMTSVSNAWETLAFDVSSVAGQAFNQVVLLFDPGNFTEDQYFWDNMGFVAPPTTGTLETLAGVDNFVAYPNPTAGNATFEYDLTEAAMIQLQIFDYTGRPVQTLVNATQYPGAQQVNWNTTNLANGIYFYSLSVNGKIATGKISVVK